MIAKEPVYAPFSSGPAPKFRDLKGRRFGRLVVVSLKGFWNHRAHWLCQCDCGGEKIVGSSALNRGAVSSCGCLMRELQFAAGDRTRTHGGTGMPEYRVWRGIIDRCFHPSHKSYADYGGRGVKMCPRWRFSFAAFLSDMGRRPTPGHTIERTDTEGDYEPSNCCWATWKEQQRNRRNNRIITALGESLCLAEWSERTGIHASTISRRLKVGWTTNRAVLTVVGCRED